VGAIGLGSQIGQQCPDFVRFKMGDGLIVECYLKRAQETDGKMCHGSSKQSEWSGETTDIEPNPRT
jgi:hypothetical protein